MRMACRSVSWLPEQLLWAFHNRAVIVDAERTLGAFLADTSMRRCVTLRLAHSSSTDSSPPQREQLASRVRGWTLALLHACWHV